MTDYSKFLVSVVVPCYNCASTIEKCIGSIYDQNVLPFEILAINDGSQDQSLSLLKKIKESCPPEITFHIIDQDNSGPSVARNKAILLSKGNWIAFLDSDDYWDKRKLDNQLNYLMQDKAVKLLGNGKFNKTDTLISLRMLLRKNYFQTSSVIVDKNIMLAALFNESQKYSEDYRSWLKIASMHKAAVISPVMAYQIDNHVKNFGGFGLSSKLWEMQKGELSNYSMLLHESKISVSTYLKIVSFSMLKYCRRVIINAMAKTR